jgi:hypothetical protein
MIDSPSAHLREESFILLRLLWIISYMEMIDFYFCSSQRRIFHFITPFVDPRGGIIFYYLERILSTFACLKRRIFHFTTPFVDH